MEFIYLRITSTGISRVLAFSIAWAVPGLLPTWKAMTRSGSCSSMTRFRLYPADRPNLFHSAGNSLTSSSSLLPIEAAILSTPLAAPEMIVVPGGSVCRRFSIAFQSVQSREPQTNTFMLLLSTTPLFLSGNPEFPRGSS